MFSKQQLSFKYIPLSNITIHDGIPQNLLHVISSVTNRLSQSDGFTTHGLELFLQMHPIHVIKVSRKEKYECISGLRGYQLASSCLKKSHPIPTLIHRKTKKEDVENIAITDTLLTTLVYGLDKLSWSNDVLNLFDSIDANLRKEILLSLSNKKKLQRLLSRSCQSMYTKAPPPISSLKQKQSGNINQNKPTNKN